MKVAVNNITEGNVKNIDIKDISNVSDFIQNLYLSLEVLKPKSYYCIIFKYKNEYEKIVKAKLGYIYIDINNENRIMLSSDENYLTYYINKYSIEKLEIDCMKCIGIPQKINIQIDREPLAMGDDGPYSEKTVFSPETRLSSWLRYNDRYKVLKALYTNHECEEKSTIIIYDGKMKIEDLPLSEFIEINKIDIQKNIIFELKKN